MRVANRPYRSRLVRFVFTLLVASIISTVCSTTSFGQGNQGGGNQGGNQGGGNQGGGNQGGGNQGGGVRPSRKYPADRYYAGRRLLADGEYKDAAEVFRRSMSDGLKIGNIGWIDFVCYHAMIGETLYQAGEYHTALAQYNLAIETLLRFPRFLTTLQTPQNALNRQPVPRQPNWGPRTRRAQLSGLDRHLPSTVRSPGFLTLPGGGSAVNFDNRVSYMLDAGEVTRCASLALFRRRELMGPACSKHPYTRTIQATLSSATNVLPNHWTTAWYNSMLGMALANGDDKEAALNALQASLLIEGRFDHPATPIALMGIGQLFMEQGAYQQASVSFLEATYPAVEYRQYVTLGDAFHRATLAHIAQQSGKTYDPVVAAVTWAGRERGTDHLLASLILDATDSTMEVTGVQTLKMMDTWVNQADGLMKRNELRLGILGQRALYHKTRIQLRAGKVAAGEKFFSDLMAHKRKSSLWLYQISLVDEMLAKGVISPRIASDLYEIVLRVPMPNDWVHQPTEALTVLLNPSLRSFERWFEITMSREKYEAAMVIADEIRRRRFFQTLPLGGRLMGLRWVMGASPDALGKAGLAERQTFVARFPNLAQWQTEEEAVRRSLHLGQLVPNDETEAAEQVKLLQQFAAIAVSGEAALIQIATERVPSSLNFPPPAQIDAIKDGLGQRKLVLSFFATSRAVYGFALDNGKYGAWQISSPNKLRAEVAALLQSIGNYNKNSEIGDKALKADWQSLSMPLFARLTNSSGPVDWSKYDELVIIPDGILWYLPFEMLTTSAEDPQPLLSNVRIRYSPTLALAVPSARPIRNHGDTLLKTGSLFPGEDDDVIQARAERLSMVVPNTYHVNQLPAPSTVFAPFVDRAVIYLDLEEKGGALPYAWSPFSGERGVGIVDWMRLPWGAPDQLVLPGFHTNAESGLKSRASGDEIFLAACGLMASGSRSVLLSRWRVGGSSTESLISEYVQELPYRSAPESWQRSVELFRSTELDPMSEPRMQSGAVQHAMTAEHPFFWAGYMLIDDGGKITK